MAFLASLKGSFQSTCLNSPSSLSHSPILLCMRALHAQPHCSGPTLVMPMAVLRTVQHPCHSLKSVKLHHTHTLVCGVRQMHGLAVSNSPCIFAPRRIARMTCQQICVSACPPIAFQRGGLLSPAAHSLAGMPSSRRQARGSHALMEWWPAALCHYPPPPSPPPHAPTHPCNPFLQLLSGKVSCDRPARHPQPDRAVQCPLLRRRCASCGACSAMRMVMVMAVCGGHAAHGMAGWLSDCTSSGKSDCMCAPSACHAMPSWHAPAVPHCTALRFTASCTLPSWLPVPVPCRSAPSIHTHMAAVHT